MTRQICETCGKVIRPGQPRYTIRDSDDGKIGQHYECHERNVAEFKEAAAKLPELSSKIHSSLAKLDRIIKRGKQDRE